MLGAARRWLAALIDRDPPGCEDGHDMDLDFVDHSTGYVWLRCRRCGLEWGDPPA
jgi:hypothetical protein